MHVFDIYKLVCSNSAAVRCKEHSANFGRFVSGKPRLGRLRNRPTYLDLNNVRLSNFDLQIRGGGSRIVILLSLRMHPRFSLVGGGGGQGAGAPVLDLPLILLHFLVFYNFFFISHEEVNTFQCIYEKTS